MPIANQDIIVNKAALDPFSATEPVTIEVGKWAILCYRNSCPHCLTDFQRWVQQLVQAGPHNPEFRLATMNVGETTGTDLAADAPRQFARLRYTRSNAITTPCVLLIEDGEPVSWIRADSEITRQPWTHGHDRQPQLR